MNENKLTDKIFHSSIRFLASGDSIESLSYSFLIAPTTICNIVRETCNALWKALKLLYLKAPSSPENWTALSKEFEKKWNFIHCIGAIDGKHIAIQVFI